MTSKRNLVAAHLALLGANLFYGAGFTVAKSVMPRLIGPFGFILIRVLIVTALFWLTWTGGSAYRTTIARKDWKLLILGGVFGVALNQLMFFWGLNMTTPIHASLIMLSTPLIITIITTILLSEKLGWDKALGLALGIGGAALLILGRQQGSTANASNLLLGDLGILLNATSYAIYLIIIRPLMQRYRPIIVIRWVFLFGACMVMPFGWGQFLDIKWAAFELVDYGAIAFIVVCCTFFTYLWNTYALRYLSASTAGGYIYLQPFFAAIVAVSFAGESINALKLVAAALIFTGVYLVNFGLKRRKEVKIEQPEL